MRMWGIRLLHDVNPLGYTPNGSRSYQISLQGPVHPGFYALAVVSSTTHNRFLLAVISGDFDLQ